MLICLICLIFFPVGCSLSLVIHIARDIVVTWIRYILPKKYFHEGINSGKIKTVFQFIFLFWCGCFTCQSYQAILPLIMTYLFTLTLSAYIIYFASIVLSVAWHHYIKYFLKINEIYTHIFLGSFIAQRFSHKYGDFW